jgi:PadR family transcriptional regulator, regulatory protein PadR
MYLPRALMRLAGVDIQKLSGLPTGTIYPIMLRFESAGLLDSEWEDIDPKGAGRPRKRFYWLTPDGFARATEALSYLGSEVPAWA